MGQILVRTHGALATMPWQYCQRGKLTDGVIIVMVDDDGLQLGFSPRGTNELYSTIASSIMFARKVGGGLNIAVDYGFVEPDGTKNVWCLVGPRGRMKKVFNALGYPLNK